MNRAFVVCSIILVTITWVGQPMALAQCADGTVFFTEAVSTDWDNALNWKTACTNGAPAAIPGTSDRAVICSGKTCVMDNTDSVTVLSICVQSTATLTVESGCVLSLGEVTTSGLTSQFDGTVNLSGEIDIILPDDTPTSIEKYNWTGSGAVVGQASGAKILIPGDYSGYESELVVSTTIRGILEINQLDDDGYCSVVLKGGTLHADANGTLKVYPDRLRDRGPSLSYWKVTSHNNAILHIDVNCAAGIYCGSDCLCYTEWHVFRGTLDLEEYWTTKQKVYVEVLNVGGAKIEAEKGIHPSAPSCPSCDG